MFQTNNPYLQPMPPQQQIMNLLQSSDPQKVFEEMLNNNPQFKKFVEENKDLTPQQMCQKYGVNPAILNFMK